MIGLSGETWIISPFYTLRNFIGMGQEEQIYDCIEYLCKHK
jgi:hypothetical protein